MEICILAGTVEQLSEKPTAKVAQELSFCRSMLEGFPSPIFQAVDAAIVRCNAVAAAGAAVATANVQKAYSHHLDP